MSAFDTNITEATTNPNDQQPGESNENYLERMVGEGKKFKDAEALARGKFESDNHIQNLERQLSELRQDLSKDEKVNELLELVRSQSNQGTAETPNRGDESGKEGDGTNPNETSSGLTEEQLRALIESTVSERESTTKRQDNLSQVDEVLEKQYGSKASEFVRNKSKELGMSIKELEDMAARNPTAFFRLTDVKAEPRSQSTVVGGGRSSETEAGKSGGQRKNFNYYQEMRRNNRKLYYSPSTQHEMHREAEAQGESFYE